MFSNFMWQARNEDNSSKVNLISILYYTMKTQKGFANHFARRINQYFLDDIFCKPFRKKYIIIFVIEKVQDYFFSNYLQKRQT